MVIVVSGHLRTKADVPKRYESVPDHLAHRRLTKGYEVLHRPHEGGAGTKRGRKPCRADASDRIRSRSVGAGPCCLALGGSRGVSIPPLGGHLIYEEVHVQQ
jgi:hypothetical protein